MEAGQQAARLTDPVTHGLGMLGILGGMLIGAAVGALLIISLPVTAPALVVGLTAAAAVGAVAGGGLAGHQLIQGIQKACSLPSPTTGVIGIVGSPNVRIGNLAAARVIVDMATPCNGLFGVNHMPIPPLPPAPIAEGAKTIRINGFLAARVTSKLVCGASIKKGEVSVFYGGPTQRVLQVFDAEEELLSALGFLAKASLAAMFLMTLPLGIGAVATFAAVFGGFVAINHGLGKLGDHIGPGWHDILQGGFGMASIVVGGKIGADALSKMPSGKPVIEGEPPPAVPSAKDLAQQRAAEIRTNTPSNKRLPTATSAAVDRTNGKFYFGESGRPQPSPESIHPDLESRIPDPSLEKWSPTNCAEFRAVNSALNDGSNINNLDLYTVRTETGNPFPRCSNCQVTTSGANVPSDLERAQR